MLPTSGHLADYGVNTFDLSEEELIHDLESARGDPSVANENHLVVNPAG